MRILPLLVVSTLAVAVISTSVFGADAPAEAILFEENLALVPPTDPAVETAPKILPALQGQHPRLLFTPDQIIELKKQIAADPILTEAAADIIAAAKRTKPPTGNPPAIVTADTPALASSVGNFAGLAVAFALDPDPKIKETIVGILQVMLDQPYWAVAKELDSNMGAGNNMLMVALLFDAVANDLDPEFREKLEEKILTHVRRMYYLGHQKRSINTLKYWQQDPQNNHRWHRNAGMTACLLAIADNLRLDTAFLLDEHKKEVDFIFQWYPKDGDCHEGAAYQRFGFFYLALTARMMDQVLGTDYLNHPGLANAWKQQMYYWIPGSNGGISFGDDQNTRVTFNHLDAAFFLSPSINRDKNIQSALKRKMAQTKVRADGRPNPYPWSLLVFYDGSVGEGDDESIPRNQLFADLGAASMRDSWKDDAVVYTFKCGPYGGYSLNDYRHAVREENGNPHYVNVAHDDPDANAFAMAIGDESIFHPGVYATKKLTETHSTLTINSKGQIGEGDAYTQPVGKSDMRELSYLTGWKEDSDGRVIVEGEAGNAYPALKQFRRTSIWMPGEYILVLDNVVGDGSCEIAWRGTVEKAQFEDPANGKCFTYTKGGKRLDFQILANREFDGAIDHMFLPGRWGSLLMQQFQFSVKSDAVKFACLMDPWKTRPVLTMAEKDQVVTLTVKSDKFEDVWTWKNPADGRIPSAISGQRSGKPLIALGSYDKAPNH